MKLSVWCTVPSHLKVACPSSGRFWGLKKSVKMRRKSLGEAVFFGSEFVEGISEIGWEMISRNLGAISRDLARQFARFGDVGKIGA